MTLDDFIDFEDSTDQSDKETNKQEATKEYTGNDALEITPDQVQDVLSDTNQSFSKQVHISSQCSVADSKGGQFKLVVEAPTERPKDKNCISVYVVQSQTLYKAIEPYKINPTEGWEEELKNVIETIIQNKDDIVLCSNCGSVMIIKTTLTHGEKIRGCSNYPNCRNTGEI